MTKSVQFKIWHQNHNVDYDFESFFIKTNHFRWSSTSFEYNSIKKLIERVLKKVEIHQQIPRKWLNIIIKDELYLKIDAFSPFSIKFRLNQQDFEQVH